jgi:hypothetical protein
LQCGGRRTAAEHRKRRANFCGEIRRLGKQVDENARHVGENVQQVVQRLLQQVFRVEVVEIAGTESRELNGGAIERTQHLGGRHACRERCAEHGARAEPHVDVEIGDLSVDEEIVERLQAAELEGAAGERAARQHERHFRVLLANREIALLNDGDAHGSSNLPRGSG